MVGPGQEWLFTLNVVVPGFFHFLPTHLPSWVGEEIAPWLWFQKAVIESRSARILSGNRKSNSQGTKGKVADGLL